MNEAFAKLLDKIKANKGTVIRITAVAVGALIGVAVAGIVISAQESEFVSEDMLPLETDELDDESVEITE